MRSAKTLKNTLPQWSKTPHPRDGRPTIFVVGYQSNPAEPLLLEALANHPGCKKLYFIPLDGPAGELNRSAMHHDNKMIEKTYGKEIWHKALEAECYHEFAGKAKHGELLAYDVTDLLKHNANSSRGAAAVDSVLKAHFDKREVVPVTTAQCNIYLSGHNYFYYDIFVPRRNPGSMQINDPLSSVWAGFKASLPDFGKHIHAKTGLYVTPPCKSVESLDDIRTFMDDRGYNEIVLKQSLSSCGRGVFRIFRNQPDGPLMGEKPQTKGDTQGKQVFTLTKNFINPKEPMLAMEWLDNSKGDIRAVIVNGSCIGAYIRHHAPDTWLCNFAQGGSIRPIDMKRDLCATDRHKLRAIAECLQACGINYASIDLLADHKGERFLSEINIGKTNDLVELSTHWDHQNAKFGRLCVADQVAADLMEDYRDHVLFFVSQAYAKYQSAHGGTLLF